LVRDGVGGELFSPEDSDLLEDVVAEAEW